MSKATTAYRSVVEKPAPPEPAKPASTPISDALAKLEAELCQTRGMTDELVGRIKPILEREEGKEGCEKAIQCGVNDRERLLLERLFDICHIISINNSVLASAHKRLML